MAPEDDSPAQKDPAQKDSAQKDSAQKGPSQKRPAKKAGRGKRPAKPGSVPAVTAGGRRPIPWMTVGAVVVVLAIVGALTGYLAPKYMDRAEVQTFVPSASNPDPSDDISGVKKVFYPAGQHVSPTQRVAYDQSPPFGGPHDAVWATCTGIVYPKELRSENAVHALEHGSVWITYNPSTIKPGDLDILKSKVEGKSYMLLSPYPGLSTPISLQSWGHQLKLESAGDKRVDEFITALKRNSQVGVYKEQPQQAAYPEISAECAAIPDAFDPSNPPPPDSGPVPADAVKMNGDGTQQATNEAGVTPVPPTAATTAPTAPASVTPTTPAG